MENRETLLKVEHLCQYFGRTKAVDDVSFDIKKGEVFGLVGESGCGKTTTGRSIIKIYDITSGSIYFKGQRICAGAQSYRNEIADCKKAISELKKLGTADTQEKVAKCNERIAELKKSDAADAAEKIADCKKTIAELRKSGADAAAKEIAAKEQRIQVLKAEIASAKADHKNSDKEYAKTQVKLIEEKYAGKELTNEQKKQKAEELRVAKKTRLITQIQMIFQDPIASLDPRMTVREIIAEGLIINGIKDKKVIDEKVFEILEMVGLVREHADRYPHEFSGGQRQRIGIARAVIMNPELLIADEPISALDVSIQAQVINLLNELREKLGLSILFIAHDLSVVKYFSDRIGVMYFGHMVELAESDELFAHPMHPYTRSLLSAIPLPDPHSERNRKRVSYNPLAEHDYSVDKPTLREILPGHFVSCNDAEELAFKKELGIE